MSAQALDGSARPGYLRTCAPEDYLPLRDSLDTSEQLRRSEPGRSPDLAPAAVLARRARAKFFSQPLAAALAAQGGDLRRAYERTLDCAALLNQAGGRITSRYCGARWCLVCNRIRIARAVDAYEPILSAWAAPHFVTLTVPNVPGRELRGCIESMYAALRQCAQNVRRYDAPSLVALRKLECTYSLARRDYHPHYHLVVDGEPQASALVARWLSAWPLATRAAQDVRPADPGTLRELFKYFTKLTAKPNAPNVRRPLGGLPNARVVPAAALDTIFRAMYRKRVYQPMGFKLSADLAEEGEIATDEATAAPSRAGEEVAWTWVQSLADWVDGETGECLSGYEPGKRFRAFVGGIGSTPA